MTKAKLFYLHEGLPRQAPGSDRSTRDAIARLGPLPANPRILDLGCGPGRSALVLAEVLRGHVTAIDLHEPYLDQLAASAAAAGLRESIAPRRLSMNNLRFRPGSFDLIWAEGSAYFVGIRKSLDTWLPLLKPGGFAVFSELCWLGAERPAEAVAYWDAAYPEMGTAREHLTTAAELGYTSGRSWVLPESDWWDEYLGPLASRMNTLAAEAANDSDLAELIKDSRYAIALFRQHSRSFGYVLHVARKPA